MASVRDTLMGVLAQAMRGSMHPPQHADEPEVTLKAPQGMPEGEAAPIAGQPLHREFPDSWIESLDYDPKTKELTLWMKGSNYDYTGIEQSDVDGFLSSDDPGEYFNDEFHPFHSSR